MKRTLAFLTLLFTLFVSSAQAQPGSLDLSFTPGTGFNGPVNALAVQTDDKLICVGQFTTYQGVSRRGIVRINSDGSIDNTFTTGTGFASVNPPNFVINAVALQSDGKILCGGVFNSYNGTVRKHILRLNANGTIDATFGTTTGGANGNVFALLVHPSGNIFCGGIFTTYDGQPRHLVAKLNSNGGVSNSFTTGSGFAGTALRVSSLCFGRTAGFLDGGVICGGTFNTYRGQPAKSLCKMNSNGETSTNWYGGQVQLGPMGSAEVSVITEVPGGNGYYIGGNFTTPANRICKLDLGGNLVASFGSTGYDEQVRSIVPYTTGSGSIICGGGFQNYAGAPCNRIARLSTNGLHDASFIQGTGFNDVTILAKAVSGKVYCAGSFTTYNGVPRTGVARLNTDATAMMPGNTVRSTRPVGSEFETSMVVWPNPAVGGHVSVQFSVLEADLEHAEITLFDASGKQVMVQRSAVQHGAAQITLLLNDLPPGIYSVVVLAGTNTYSRRLVLV